MEGKPLEKEGGKPCYLLASLGPRAPGPGAGPPRQPVQGETHDALSRRDVPRGRPEPAGEHATVPHPPQHHRGHALRGGELLTPSVPFHRVAVELVC